MKVLFINAHGKSKVDYDWFAIPSTRNVTFLCKFGKTLSVDQVKEFIDQIIINNTLVDAITSTVTIKSDNGINPKQLLEKYVLMKNDLKNIDNDFLLKIAEKQFIKLHNFIISTFNLHENIGYGVPDLYLTHDDNPNGSAIQVVSYLKNKGFVEMSVTIYNDNAVGNPNQLYILFDFNKLKNDGFIDIVYLTPSNQIPTTLLSNYIDTFKHAYILYDKTKNKPLESFLNNDSTNTLLNQLSVFMSNDLNLVLYDYGDIHNNVVVGACREIEGFDFGYQI